MRSDGTLTCRQIRRMVQAFLDGELPGSSADAVEAHLDRCEECGLEAEAINRVRHAIAGLRTPDKALPTDRLLAKVRAQPE